MQLISLFQTSSIIPISNNVQSSLTLTPATQIRTLITPSSNMNQFNNQNQVPVAYMAPPTSYPPPAVDTYNGPYVTAPPPMGYPTTKEGEQHWDGSVETKSKGDGFLRGCLAGLCCCCCLDMCF